MAKPAAYPPLLDEVFTLSTTELQAWGYLQPNQSRCGTVTRSRGSRKLQQIVIEVSTYPGRTCLYLGYYTRGELVLETIELVTLPSNLGRGRVWFFRCPVTGRRCRKLYLVGKRFLHRQAYRGCLYACQARSHKNRDLVRLLQKVFVAVDVDTVLEQLTRKYFKRHYAGKPTKRYARLMAQLEACQQVKHEDFERFYY